MNNEQIERAESVKDYYEGLGAKQLLYEPSCDGKKCDGREVFVALMDKDRMELSVGGTLVTLKGCEIIKLTAFLLESIKGHDELYHDNMAQQMAQYYDYIQHQAHMEQLRRFFDGLFGNLDSDETT